MKTSLTIFLLSILIFGCTPKVMHYDYFVRNAEIEESKIIRSTVICDLNIDFTKRVSATSKEHRGNDRAEKAKEEAYFNALVNNNIDVLVSPIYQIEQSEKTAIATVYGFAGMYVNARTKAKALEEIQGIDSSSFFKYELVWGGAKIAPYSDNNIVKIINGNPNMISNKISESENSTLILKSSGPSLIYPESTQNIRKEKKLESFKRDPEEIKQLNKRRVLAATSGFFVLLITTILLQTVN
ncbi:MAG: hypothetical protein RL062_184 [Bacteroidota bacterium]|jgi:hypothetical protein